MVTRNNLLAGLVAASFAAFAAPSYAEVYISIDPPARRVEKFEVRPGQVFIPGIWQWEGKKHVWHEGHYVPERAGYRYQNDRWVQHDNKKWTMQRGGWSRDSDGDGTPDRIDNRPNDPRRQ